MYTYFPGFIATPTKIRNFLECPRKYWYYHINPETKRKFPEKSYFTLGQHVHTALRDFLTVPSSNRKPEMLLEFLESAWRSKNGTAGGFRTQEEENLARQRAVSMLERFLARENWRVSPFLLPEKEGEIPGYKQVELSKDLAFGGIIDRMDKDEDGNLHIIDYKTGRGDEPDKWQLPMYAVLMSRKLNTFVGRISYLFLEKGTTHTEEITIDKNLDTMERVEDVVAKIPKSKLKEDFVCPQGDNCRHCEYLRELGYDPKTGLKLDAPKEPSDPYSPDLPF